MPALALLHRPGALASPRERREAASGDVTVELPAEEREDDDIGPAELVQELSAVGARCGDYIVPPADLSFTELLFEPWDGFDMRAACLMGGTSAVPAAAVTAAVGAAQDGDEDYSIDELL